MDRFSAHRLLSSLCIAFLLLVVGVSGAMAQTLETYPNRPIRIVIAVTTGGAVDALARTLAQKLTEAWGQPVIVESRPGANGMLATSFLAKAPADGYTVLFGFSSVVQNLVVQPSPLYRLNELAPVAMVAAHPIGYAINTSVKANSLAEFVELARSKPKEFSYASWGTASTGHMMGEMLSRAGKIDLLHVPYKGEAPEITDLIGGQISSAFASVGSLSRLGEGKIRILGVTGARRLTAYPNVPTFSEAGFPALSSMSGWSAVFLPASTPKDIVDKLSREIVRIVRLPDVSAKILDLGFEPDGRHADALNEEVKAEFKKWDALVKETRIKLE